MFLPKSELREQRARKKNQFLPNWKMFGSLNKFLIIFDVAFQLSSVNMRKSTNWLWSKHNFVQFFTNRILFIVLFSSLHNIFIINNVIKFSEIKKVWNSYSGISQWFSCYHHKSSQVLRQLGTMCVGGVYRVSHPSRIRPIIRLSDVWNLSFEFVISPISSVVNCAAGRQRIHMKESHHKFNRQVVNSQLFIPVIVRYSLPTTSSHVPST